MSEQAIPKLGTINIQEILAAEGMELADSTPEGSLVARSKSSGKEFQVGDKKKFVETFLQKNQPDALQNGVTIDNFDILVNDADSAFDTVPLSILDRGRMSVGNVSGNKKFLESKFDEVSMNQAGDVVVRKGDSWHKIDREGLGNGDAWDQFKEFSGDIADHLGDAATIIPSLAAVFTTGPLGAAAGAAVGSGLRTTMGRALGTYGGDVEEQMKDLALESMMGIAGYGVGKVAGTVAKNAKQKVFDMITEKPEMLGVHKMVGKFKEMAEPVRDMLANVFSFTTGTSSRLTKQLVTDPDGVNLSLSTISKAKNYELGKQRLSLSSNANIKTAIDNGVNGMFKEMKALENQAIAKAKGSVVDLSESYFELQGKQGVNVLAEGSVTKTAGDPFLQQFYKQSDNGASSLISEDEFKKLIKFDLSGAQMSKIYKGLRSVDDVLSGVPDLTKVSMEKAIEVRRAFDDLIFDSGLSDEAIEVLEPYSKKFRSKVVEQIKSLPGGDDYAKMTEFAVSNKKYFAEAKRLRDTKNLNAYSESVNKYVAAAGEQDEYKFFVDTVAKYSPSGSKRTQLVLNNEAAKRFVSIFPPIKNLASGSGLVLGSALYSSDQGELSAGAGIGAAALLSPRLLAKSVQGMSRATNMMGIPFRSGLGEMAARKLPAMYAIKETLTRLPMSEKAKLLKDPATLGRILAPVMMPDEDIK
jgi:hypothetical protein